jgi:hypothetical protein
MTSERDRHTRVHDEKAARILVDRLRLMFDWYKGMVDEGTGRFLYLYDPETDVTVADGEPIRDIATVWDVQVLSAFLERDELHPVIRRSLDHFSRLIVERDDYAIVAPRGAPSIAHSAFLALALSHTELPDKIARLTPLIDGILHQQRQDGSYKIFFGTEPDSGEELYPAEAMLAGVRRGCLRAGSARRRVRDRRVRSGSADQGLSAMRPDGAWLSHARTADDRLHGQRAGWLWRLARKSRAADRRDRPCSERVHQEYRERDRRTYGVIVAGPTGSWCGIGSCSPP